MNGFKFLWVDSCMRLGQADYWECPPRKLSETTGRKNRLKTGRKTLCEELPENAREKLQEKTREFFPWFYRSYGASSGELKFENSNPRTGVHIRSHCLGFGGGFLVWPWFGEAR